jgi:hypothetical protein
MKGNRFAMLRTTPIPAMTRSLLPAVLLYFLALSPGSAQFSPLNPNDPTLQPAGQANYVLPVYGEQSFEVISRYSSGEAQASALRQAPAKLYSFDRASLRDVLRYLAEDAGIPFLSMLERAPTDGATGTNVLDAVLITFTMRAAPFVVLEAIAKANDIQLDFQNGIWVIRATNENELIGRIYRLKFTPQERVIFDSAAGGPSSQVPGTGTQQGTTASIPNLNRQQAQNVFQVEEPALVQEIKNMLRIQSRGLRGSVAPGEASVGNFPALPEAGGISPAWARQSDALVEVAEPTVTFNSDTNSIYIVATRQQHDWVEGFLAAADQPQALIGIEVKFFETTKDPRKELGVDWGGTLRGGFTVAANDITVSPGGTVTLTQDRERDSLSGTPPPDRSTFDTFASTTTYQASIAAPYSAVLSASQVAFTIQAFMEERDTSIVQYPRVLTVNNREVAISNALNQPILGSTQQSQTGGSTQTTNTIEYLPIGTQLNILPKTMPDDSVYLSIAITISNLLRFERINNGVSINDYPVTSSRVYQAALQVDPGYTLAVGGLEEAVDQSTRNGVPLLQDIPGLGELFKSRGRTQQKRNLIVFITPTVIYNRTETSGITDLPITTLPQRPGSVPRPPAFTPNGELVGGVDALQEAIRWLEYQVRFYRELDRESRVDRTTIEQLRGIMNTAMMIQSQIPVFAAAQPSQAAFLSGAERTFENLIAELNRILTSSRSKIIYY